jgi:hypothetical protein
MCTICELLIDVLNISFLYCVSLKSKGLFTLQNGILQSYL